MFCILQYNDIFMPNNMIIWYRNQIYTFKMSKNKIKIKSKSQQKTK